MLQSEFRQERVISIPPYAIQIIDTSGAFTMTLGKGFFYDGSICKAILLILGQDKNRDFRV